MSGAGEETPGPRSQMMDVSIIRKTHSKHSRPQKVTYMGPQRHQDEITTVTAARYRAHNTASTETDQPVALLF